jgi:hypothetical protein
MVVKKIIVALCMICSVSGLVTTAQADDPTTQELMDYLVGLNSKLDNITVKIDALNSSVVTAFYYVNGSINDINFTGVNSLSTDLEIISHELADIQKRLGYPITKPDASIYDDLTFILDGLTYQTQGGVKWLLKNDTGYPYMTVLGENQRYIAEYQLNQTSILKKEVGTATTEIKANTNAAKNDILGSIGSNFYLLIIVLIIALFLLAWKFYLQQRFAQKTSGRPLNRFNADGRPNFEGSGRPACFGDQNKFDPGNSPDCVSCPYVNKCQTAIVRDLPMDGEEPQGMSAAMKPRYDYAGNIVAVFDAGQPINLPACFGKEYDQNNADCQECAVNTFCAEQQQRPKNIAVPPQPKMARQQQNNRRGSAGRQWQVQGRSTPNILSDF